MKSLPANLIRVLKAGRYAAYSALRPLDYSVRLLNGKGDFPPLTLRRYVGPLRTFEMSGAEFLCYLQLLAELQPEERMLDIGCGCGLMALHLKNYLNSKATYTGIDIHAPSVKWSQNNISKKYPNFAFAHIDARNQVFNPRSEHPSETYSLPFDDESFDVILLKSVFTHMRPPEIDNYIGQVARLLSHRGRCLMTFFLLNEPQAELATQRLNTLDFAFGNGTWRYVYSHSPESAVAHSESNVLEFLRKHGLRLKRPIMYGRWSGRHDGLSYQDMLLVERA